MRYNVERTFLTTADGRRTVAEPDRFVVQAESLSSALESVVHRTNSTIYGCITETAHRAVCTGSSNGRLCLFVAEPESEAAEE